MSRSRIAPMVLAVILGGAAVYAFARSRADTPMPDPLPTAVDPSALPPNHPPISSHASTLPHLADMRDEKPQIQWNIPDGWAIVPGSPVRLATYHLPAASGAADEAEVSVTRAGGAVDSNVQRWVGQFDEAGQDTRQDKTVAGFKVTIVEVSGTYTGNAMSPTQSPNKKGWSLLGAIVQTPGSPYFFKATGPTPSVKASREAFLKMIDGLTPVTQ
jgi:hypothetical protein